MSTSWWDSPQWHAYELAYGDEPGTRSRLLASADWSTQVIDLTADERPLWLGIRKGYRTLIPRVHAIEAECSSWDIHGFRVVHFQAAGRATRPVATWDLMATWIEQKRLLLVGHGIGAEWQAFAGFIIHDGLAYYGYAGCLRPDANHALNVNHALIWSAMRTLKARGVRVLEMGWQDEATDKKGRDIEFFRRGFGGISVPVKDFYANGCHYPSQTKQHTVSK